MANGNCRPAWLVRLRSYQTGCSFDTDTDNFNVFDLHGGGMMFDDVNPHGRVVVLFAAAFFVAALLVTFAFIFWWVV